MARLENLKEQAREHLEEGEEVVAVVMGAYEAEVFGADSVKNGIFLATNSRLVFYAKKLIGFDLEVFPYQKISSIEMSKGMLGHKISFFATGNKATMKWIGEGDVAGFVDYVNAQMGKQPQEAQATTAEATIDIPAQIKKLAELMEQGILTDEEFATKKAELLAKM